VNELEHFVL